MNFLAVDRNSFYEGTRICRVEIYDDAALYANFGVSHFKQWEQMEFALFGRLTTRTTGLYFWMWFNSVTLYLKRISPFSNIQSNLIFKFNLKFLQKKIAIYWLINIFFLAKINFTEHFIDIIYFYFN